MTNANPLSAYHYGLLGKPGKLSKVEREALRSVAPQAPATAQAQIKARLRKASSSGSKASLGRATKSSSSTIRRSVFSKTSTTKRKR